tara:strand:- start:134 stop:406 length:273 start_codon:yes stop_codon:yes gene_type:complete
MLHYDYFFRRRRTNLKEWVKNRGYRDAHSAQQALTSAGVEPPNKEVLDKVISEIYPKPPKTLPEKKPAVKKTTSTRTRSTRSKKSKKSAQ